MGILEAALNFGARAAQIGDQAKQNQTPAQKTEPAPETEKQRPEGALADERVTLEESRRAQGLQADLPIREYKHSVANDTRFVQETLGAKLSELGVSLDTPLSVKKNSLGDLEVEGKIAPEKRDRIESDLNQNRPFKAAFDRLSVNQPTLEYLDNVSRLSQAYGTGNSLFESLLSERSDNNNLQDIAHRYQEMRKQVAAENQGLADERGGGYEIRFNV